MPPSEPSLRRVPARRIAFGTGLAADLVLAVPVEVPVEIVVGGIPFAVMMASPDDLADFARGFCLTEGIVETAAEIRAIASEEVAGIGWRLSIHLSPSSMTRHLARRRVMSGRTGCGVCGIEDLAAMERRLPPVGVPPTIGMPALRRALDALEERQHLHAQTRAVHGAAWADAAGRLTHVREDVGRHNALDKLIGALLQDDVDPASGFVLVTSRCSFEMVDKAAAFGAGMLVAISAPTSLALDRAERLGMRLVAIARQDGAMVFVEGGRAVPAERVA